MDTLKFILPRIFFRLFSLIFQPYINTYSGCLSMKNKYYFLFILFISLFFLWGFDHNLNPILIPHLKKAYQLTGCQNWWKIGGRFLSNCFVGFYDWAFWRHFLDAFYYFKSTFGYLFGTLYCFIGNYCAEWRNDVGLWFN